MAAISTAGTIQDAQKIFALLERRHWAGLWILLAATIIISFLEVARITAILPVFQIMLEPERVARFAWFRPIFGDMPISNFFLWLCLAIFVLFAVKVMVSLFVVWLKWRIQSRLYQSLAARLLRSYLYSPLSFHLRHGPTELLRNLHTYVAQTTQYGFLGFVDLTSDILLALGIFLALLWVEPLVSTLAVAGLGAAAAVYLRLAQPYFVRLGARYKGATAKLFKTATESMAGIKTLKVLGCEKYFEDVYHRHLEEYCDIILRNSFVGAVPRQVLELMAVG